MLGVARKWIKTSLGVLYRFGVQYETAIKRLARSFVASVRQDPAVIEALVAGVACRQGMEALEACLASQQLPDEAAGVGLPAPPTPVEEPDAAARAPSTPPRPKAEPAEDDPPNELPGTPAPATPIAAPKPADITPVKPKEPLGWSSVGGKAMPDNMCSL